MPTEYIYMDIFEIKEIDGNNIDIGENLSFLKEHKNNNSLNK